MREGAPSLSDALDAFLEDVAIRRASGTVRVYEIRLRCLRTHDWPLTASVCRQLVAEQLKILSPASVGLFVGALMAFSRFCREQGWILDDPTHKLPYPKPPLKPHRYLSESEVGKLEAACLDDTERLTLILLRTGLRAAELLSIKREDIDDGLILVKGKGSRYRYVPLPAEAVPLLPDGTLVPWPYHILRKKLAALGKRAGVAGVRPHLFRHTFATRFIQETDMTTVQIVGGWSSDIMLRRYARSTIQRVAAQKIRRAMEEG